MIGNLWGRVRRLFSPALGDDEIRDHLDRLRKEAPTPVFWMVGKTQSGKTSLVRYLTGAERAEIGKGFQPCTRFSNKYVFPSEQAPLLCFLDTRGLDEPGYDPAEDIARFDSEAHVVLVEVKALDHAQQNVLNMLKRLRETQRQRPIVLILTCLHEAYPQQQHVLPYPFGPDAQLLERLNLPEQLAALATSIAEQKRRFEGLVDRVVAVDLTPTEEGFNEPNYGGEALRQVLLDVLPAAQAQSLRTLELAQKQLKDLYASRAQPTILGYATLAGTAGAIPIPFVDLALISAVQTRMVYELARLYGQPLTVRHLGELASTLGLGLLTRQAGRELIKVIPGLGTVIGSVAGGALAAASTYALGQAFCYYYRAVLQGHVPDPADLRRYYKNQLDQAETAWKELHPEKK
jgi:uncharacterized protein (DUF697 family)/predicted GTPase